MDKSLFELTQSDKPSTTLKLGISDARFAEIHEIVMMAMFESLNKGGAILIQQLWVEAQTVHEFGFMCKMVGMIEVQLVLKNPSIMGVIPSEYLREFDISELLKRK